MALAPLPPVSGRYYGRDEDVEVELRVDVDGERAMDRVSADYFLIDGDATVYLGSMSIDEPRVQSTPRLLTISGVTRSTWQTDADCATIAIARAAAAEHMTAELTHMTSRGDVRAVYSCAFVSSCFRRVILEEDVEEGVERIESYDTGLLPSACTPRTLTAVSAFEAAGVELVRDREPGVIQRAGTWSDAELHATMVQHFELFADVPQWAIWLLHALRHDKDRAGRASLGGLMFDQRGRQRQGVAVFYAGLTGTGAERPRQQLYTCVHELAHGFNLMHTFQRTLARPPLPSRPDALSWMAYPELYPDGGSAFWSRFGFEFDDVELTHLRHAMRDDVIMGGNPFAAGAAFEQDAGEATEACDGPGLRLTLRGPAQVVFGVPVTVDIELWGTTREGRLAPSVIGPRPGNVDIAIREPGRTASVFEPLLHHCRLDDAVELRAGDQPVRDSAFIHFGKDGFAFQRPGCYEVSARSVAPDGALLISNTIRIDVLEPRTRADRDVADLVFGDEQGTLMSLVGSDAPELDSGNDALQTIAERYPAHPVGAVARLVTAANAAREFKAVRRDGTLRVRPAKPEVAVEILEGTPGLDALRGAAARRAGETEMSGVVSDLLAVTPPSTMTDALHPFVRSRLDEISLVVPRLLSTGGRRRKGPGTRSGRHRRFPRPPGPGPADPQVDTGERTHLDSRHGVAFQRKDDER